jgi:hypothetical protein
VALLSATLVAALVTAWSTPLGARSTRSSWRILFTLVRERLGAGRRKRCLRRGRLAAVRRRCSSSPPRRRSARGWALYAIVGALLSAAAGYGSACCSAATASAGCPAAGSTLGNRLSRHGVVVVTVVARCRSRRTDVNPGPTAQIRQVTSRSHHARHARVAGSAVRDQLVRTMRRPEPGNVLLLIAVLAALLLVGRWIERRLTGPPLPPDASRAGVRMPGRTPGTPAPSLRR